MPLLDSARPQSYSVTMQKNALAPLRRFLGQTWRRWSSAVKWSLSRASNLHHYGQLEVFGSIVIETYSVCNRRCEFCPVGHDKRPVTRMTGEQFRGIIDQLAARAYRGEIALHFYNEPLLDQRLPEFIAYARQKCPDSFIYLNTNGDYLELEEFRKLVAEGLDWVNISQYDAQPSPRLEAFLAQAQATDRRHFSHVARLAEQTRWSNRGGNLAQWKLSQPLQARCIRPDFQLVVNCHGKVPLCCCDYYGAQEMGDVSRENVFDIWRNFRFAAVRRQLRRGLRKNLPLCQGCDFPEDPLNLPRRRILR